MKKRLYDEYLRRLLEVNDESKTDDSYGSQCHINRRESWERGEVTGAPLPVLNDERRHT